MGTQALGGQSREWYPPKMAPPKKFGIKKVERTQNHSGELPDFRRFSIPTISPLLVENRDKFGYWQKSYV